MKKNARKRRVRLKAHNGNLNVHYPRRSLGSGDLFQTKSQCLASPLQQPKGLLRTSAMPCGLALKSTRTELGCISGQGDSSSVGKPIFAQARQHNARLDASQWLRRG